MNPAQLEREIRRLTTQVNRRTMLDVTRQREDANLTIAELARAAGLDPSYLSRLEAGERTPSVETLVALSIVLGADPSIRLYPNTGPRIHDRWQAPMEQGFLRALSRRWSGVPEVSVLRPARGIIDLALLTDGTCVATEFQSQVRRLEQLIAWHRLKAESLPSSHGWSRPGSADREISRLLVLRSTRATRELASTYASVLAAAYPARTADAVAALTGDAPWPGAAIVWMRVDAGRAWLLPGPPPRVTLGRRAA